VITNRKDAVASVLFMAVGLFFLVESVSQFGVGTARRMGPGYFPMIVGGGVVALSLLLFVRSFFTRASPLGPVPWRGIVLIAAAPVAFALTIAAAGLAPAILLATLISAYASARMRIAVALAIGVGLTVFCVAVFRYGLGLYIPNFGGYLFPGG
jgi:hypothetical protein